jgi:hypothetical protein
MPWPRLLRVLLVSLSLVGCGLELSGQLAAGSAPTNATPSPPSTSPSSDATTPAQEDASNDVVSDAATTDEDAAAASAELALSVSAVPSTVNLSQEGTLDWAHWGQSSTPVRKANVTNVIGALTSQSTISPYNGYLSRVLWNDGPANAPTGDTRYFRYVQLMNGSLSVDIPASPTKRTLVIYVGGWGSRGKLDATLGVLSATDSSLVNLNDFYTGRYAITFASPTSATLKVSWTMVELSSTSYSSVEVAAATLRP